MPDTRVRVAVNGYGIMGKRFADADAGFKGAEEPTDVPTP